MRLTCCVVTPDDYPVRYELPARFADLDVNLHLNNVAASTFYEEARASMHIEQFGRWMSARPERSHFLVARTTIEYLAEGPYPAVYTVGIGVSRVGTSSFTDSLGLFVADRLIGACDTVMVHCINGASSAIPDDMRVAMDKLYVASALRPQ